MRGFGAILLALVLCVISSQANAEKRAALVIGNASYRNVPSLPNPLNDAKEIAALFRAAGFSVVEVRRDLGISEMRRAISDFAEVASDVDVAVIYFAGHGIEVDGLNYIIPVDAKLARDFDIEDETVSVDRLLKSIEPARQLRLVILDACRDNPFLKTMKRSIASRSVGRGLAKVEPAVSDTLIAFAAKAGSTAQDGDGKNSPFTLALLHNIASPGLDLRIAFGRVRDEVLKETNRRQEPFVYGSLGGSVVSIVDAPIIPPPLPTDEIVWNAIKDTGYPAIFEDFAKKFPASQRLAEALSRRDELKKRIADAAARVPPPPTADEIVWNAIRDSSHPAIFEDFVSKFPASAHLTDARVRRDELKKQIADAAARVPPPPTTDEIVWNAIKDANHPAIFEDFVSKFPSSPHLNAARARRDRLAEQIAAAQAPPPPPADEVVWNAIKASHDPAIFEEFASKYSTSRHLTDARQRGDELKKQIEAARPPPPPAADEVVWNAIKASHDPAIFEEFAGKYSTSPYLTDARQRRDELKKQIEATRPPPPPAADEVVWNAIKASHDPAIFEEFAGKYSTSPYLTDARQRRDELKKQIEATRPPPQPAADDIVWNAIKVSRDPAVFEEFMNKYPASPHLAEAGLRRDELKQQLAEAAARVPPPPATDEIVWEAIKDARAPQTFEEFLNKFPESSRQKEAKSRLDELKQSVVASLAPDQPLSDAANQHYRVKDGDIGLKVLSDSDEAALKQKAEFRECDKCPVMTVVPAGSFLMGSDDNGPKRASAKSSRHKVTFAHPFAVGRFAVTFDEWDACVADGGCKGYKPWDNGWGRGNRPVINVSWSDANSYTVWLSERTGKSYRLLSEAEREYVTRAGSQSPYWWGASVSRRQANYDDKASEDKASKGSPGQRTMPVDSFQPNPWGLYQVHGNIWEWVEDCVNEGYAGAPTDGTAWDSGHCERRVLRGGSWVSTASSVESGSRYGVQAEGRVSNVGFRVARTLKD